jgi:site-specific DNA-methyltransferase (cytosine-N4-specific)
MKTVHKIFFSNSDRMTALPSESVNLVVTSPPYPMIEMWDQIFSSMNPAIAEALLQCDGVKAHRLMCRELDRVWKEVDRVLAPSGIVCINIGDATRKIGDVFQLFSNHTEITSFFAGLGYQVLPLILWRKQSNKPNKFMGSGMLPTNAYVTLEHEYVLIFRKTGNRKFHENEVQRGNSAYFWEERNVWFSDLWTDLKGMSQKLGEKDLRERSAAYPVELAYRLINMYSVQGDMVLDPFLGTGTTSLAAMASARNSVGYEIDPNFINILEPRLTEIIRFSNEIISERLSKHREFIKNRATGGEPKYRSSKYGFEVVTGQEREIFIPFLKNIGIPDQCTYEVEYSVETDLAWQITETKKLK